MIKEIKYGGYTATPSDYECPDGELSMSVNMVPEDGTLRPLLPPSGLFGLSTEPYKKRLVFIHQTSEYKHYIIAWEDDGKEYYCYLDDADIKDLEKPISADDIEDLLKPTGTPDYFFSSEGAALDITAMGNTLILLLEEGVHYILWRNTSYKDLGQKPPELHITFGLKSVLECWPKDINPGTKADPAVCRGMTNRRDVPGMPFIAPTNAWVKPKPEMDSSYTEFNEAYTYSIEHLSGENGEAGVSSLSNRWTNFALGQLNKFVAEHATSKGKFVHPFFVRWAYELYDGTLIMHSDPILMIPNSRPPFFGMNSIITGDYSGFELEDADNQNVNFRFRGRTYGFVSELKMHITNWNESVSEMLTDDWKDIVTRLNIYVSAPIYTYKQDGRVWGWTNMDDAGSWDTYYTEGDYTTASGTSMGYGRYFMGGALGVFQAWNEASDISDQNRYFLRYSSSYNMPSYILTIPEPNTEERVRNVCKTGTFYQIASYAFDEPEVASFGASENTLNIESGVLESLVTRKTMNDDYHSKDFIKANHAFAYNGRLNMSGIVRTIHAPQEAKDAWPRFDANLPREWKIAVELDNGSGTSIVECSASANGFDVPRYLFYPDVRAKSMWFGYREGQLTKIYKVHLTEHELLEGAYWFGGLGITSVGYTEVIGWPTATSAEVKEPAKVYTSEVNNPFVIPLLGINTVGTGEILSLCSATKALSQGQFGQFPLYAFTTDGVWALQPTGTGSYSAVQPVTRDVCINDKSITQTDTGVLFATDRGIMLISGSQTVCVSEILDGESLFDVTALPGHEALLTLGNISSANVNYGDFHEFLKGCRMIYDYEHQRYIVYNPAKTLVTVPVEQEEEPESEEQETEVEMQVYDYAYIYSLKSNKWGLMAGTFLESVNSYPDALAINTDNTVVNLSDEAAFASDATSWVQGMLITRPLKLDPADALKTVDTIIQRGYFDFTDYPNHTRTVKPVRQVLYGSRDLYNWQIIWSSTDQYLRGFRGTPYKYFRLALLVDLKPDESLYGCTVRYEPRLTDQPR